MGASHSTPPPCHEVHPFYAPYRRIQVPAGTPFAIWPPYTLPRRRRLRPRQPRRIRVDFNEEDEWESESESESESGLDMDMGPRMPMGPGGRGFRMREGFGGRGMGRGVDMYEEDRPRSAPAGMGMGMDAYPRMGGGFGGGMGPPGMGGMGGGRGGMGGGPAGMGGGPAGMGGDRGDMGGGPGGMMVGPGGHGGMQRPGGMMGGPPQGMGDIYDLPPRYSSGPPRQNPYTSGPGSSSSGRSSATARQHRRRSGAHKHIAMGAFAQSPKVSRSHTSPTTAERIHRKAGGSSGKEWIKGDDFLDACICTTGCTCREGHRVLYRSRDDGGDSDGEGRYGSGEIRYILKKDLGKDCGDHTACKKDDSEKEEKMSKKEKKEEEKRRKEELQGMKNVILEALDEKLDAFKKARSSKSGSVSSPRPPFAGLSGPMGMGMGVGDPNGMMDPMMAQRLASMGMGPRMPVPPNMAMGGSNPYAMDAMGGMQAGLPGMSKMPARMVDPRQQMQMRPGQVPLGMAYEDEISIGDMEEVGLDNPYLGKGARGRGPQPRFMDAGGRREGGMMPKSMHFDAVRRGGDRDRRPRRAPMRTQQPTHTAFGSDEYDSPRMHPRATGRAASLEDDDDEVAGDRHDGDGPAATRTATPRDKTARNSRDQKQPGVESDPDDY